MDATEVTTKTDASPRRPPAVRRRPPRVAGDLAVILHTRRGPADRPIRDLSLTGLFVVGVLAPLGQEIALTLPLPGEAPLSLRGRVVRRDEGDRPGVAMVFSRIGWDDMLTLARYLAPRI